MRLFDEQGYAATTVEQIALAAEISTATFYRYYCDKENVVIPGDDHGFVEDVIAGRPPDEPLAETVRAVIRRLAADWENDRDSEIVRMRLVNSVPDLQGRRWCNRKATADLLTRLLAPRAGLPPDDHELRLAVTIALAAESETVAYWARVGGAEPLAGLLDHAVDTIEPAFNALSGRPAP
jgi:AcrR family transcriptional regulator